MIAGDDVGVEGLGGGIRLRVGGVGGLVGLAQHVLLQLLRAGLVDDAGLDEHLLEARYGVELAALLDRFARAVGAVVVVGRVRQEPVALGLDDRRAGA